MANSKHFLISLDDIPDGQAKAFTIDTVNIFVFRNGNQAYGYINQCPHMGIPLEWGNDDFMSRDGDYLQCSMHGALFEPKTGVCIWGPCNGEQLSTIELSVENGEVFWQRP
ncbi:MAG: hypothetical protein CMF25_07150 [Kangiellaceae bacterium]|jgi:nitrite reductase/ring-hydroxylating ferredoxin subunit|nr:hypothetical protein [Kangiellaceae bacterium]|tara:strand:+ start:6448 stop:6780 length:333 start_codon:yes stop_codon:yes gene_type:complete